MKLKKIVLNIVSIIILLLLMISLIIGLATVNANNTLNANNSQKPSNPTNNFEFIPARKSNLSSVNFENNFGGDGNDEILDVYNFSNHIIIGKTTSNNYYFENTNGSLFVCIVDYNGNLQSMVTASESNNFNFVNTVLFNNNIYILTNNNGYCVFEYNILKNTLKKVFYGNQTGLNISAMDEPVLFAYDESKNYIIYLFSNKTIKIENPVSNIVFTSKFGNDLLVVYNSNFSFKIAHLTKNNLTEIKSFENCNVLDYNINSINYTFLIKTKNQTEFLILDKSFNAIYNTVTQPSTLSKIYNFGSYNIMIYLNNNQLKCLEFCIHGDELASKQICNNAISFNSIIVNGTTIIVANLGSQINIYKISNYGDISLIDSFFNTEGITITNIEIVNSNLTIFGNVTQINSIITTSFGNIDFFIFEFALI